MPLHSSSIVRAELTSFWEESHKEGNAYIMGIVHSHEGEGKLAFLKKFNIRHFHISHNALYLPPRILHNLYFSFLLGSVLEYCCVVWHKALPAYLSSEIERVHMRALRIIYPTTC